MRQKTIFVAICCFLATTMLCGQVQTTMDKFIGVNARAKDNQSRLGKFKAVREYHDWSIDIGFDQNTQSNCPVQPTVAGQNDSYSWAPSKDGAANYSFDQFYQTFGSVNRRAMPALKGLAPMMRGVDNYNCPEIFEQKALCLPNGTYNFSCDPYDNGDLTELMPDYAYYPTDQNNPAAHLQHAKWASMLTARYGRRDYDNPNSPYPSPLPATINTQFLSYLGVHLATYPSGSNALKTGENRLEYIENANEPDKYWYDKPEEVFDQALFVDLDNGKTHWQYKPHQFAAMLSADYDGHGRSTAFKIPKADGIGYIENANLRFGIKNIDPYQKVVMGGLADLRGRYIEKVMDWANIHRRMTDPDYGFNSTTAKVLPFDALNFHHYSCNWGANQSDASFYENVYSHYGNFTVGGVGISPEKDRLLEKVNQTLGNLKTYASTYLPTDIQTELAAQEVWMSEFGYDTHPRENSFTNIPVSNDAAVTLSYPQRLKTQADWLVRSYLALSAVRSGTLDIDRAMMFDNVDQNPTPCENGSFSSADCPCCGQFTHSGLLTSDYKPKTSWYYVLTLKNVLTNYLFDADVTSSVQILNASNTVISQNMRVYRFKHVGNDPDNPPSSIENPTNHKFVYAIWHPSFDNTTTINARLRFGTPEFTPNNATAITMRDMDESGVKATLAKVGTTGLNAQTYGSFTVGETPVLVYTSYIAANAVAADVTVPPVQNLAGSNGCCGSVKLTWKQSKFVQNYQIYYESVDNYSIERNNELPFGDNDFNLVAEGILYADAVPGLANECIVTGLAADIHYRFFVVPVLKTSLNTPTQAAIIASSIVVQAGCNPNINNFDCITNISATQATANIPAQETEVDAVFSVAAIEDCPLLAPVNVGTYPWGTQTWGGWDNAATSSATVILGERKLNVIYILDSYGSGGINIEYADCFGCWHPLAMNYQLPVGYGKWLTLSGLTQQTVKAVRVTRLVADAKLARMVFCTSAAECMPVGSNGFQPTDIEDIAVRDIEHESAIVDWGFSQYDATDSVSDIIRTYTVQYSNREDSTGAPDGGFTSEIDIEQSEIQPSYLMSELAENTIYYGKISVSERADVCYTGTKLPFALFKFITRETPANERAEQGGAGERPLITRFDDQIQVFPNPTTSYIRIELPTAGYEFVQLTRADGAIVKQMSISMYARNFDIDCQNLTSGMYLLSVHAGNGKTLTERVVISK